MGDASLWWNSWYHVWIIIVDLCITMLIIKSVFYISLEWLFENVILSGVSLYPHVFRLKSSANSVNIHRVTNNVLLNIIYINTTFIMFFLLIWLHYEDSHSNIVRTPMLIHSLHTWKETGHSPEIPTQQTSQHTSNWLKAKKHKK